MFQHSLVFDRPGYLLLLILLPVLWRFGYRSLSGLGRWRRWIALGLRSLVFTLIVLALADVQYQRRSDRLTVVYLLDQSLSVPAAQREAMIQYVRKSIDQHRKHARRDRFAVIVFGRDAEVEIPPVEANEALQPRIESLLDPEYTDLATAIQRAKAIFPYDAAKRIVLVTDGNQNLGNGYREARTAADSGVSIDVVPVYLEPRGEIAVEKVDVPAGVRRGQPFDMRVVVHNDAVAGSGAVKGRLLLIRKAGEREERIDEQEVTIEPGTQVFTISQQIDQPDFYTYEARFVPDDPTADGMAQNNVASAFTHIQGKGLVLFIESFEKRGEFDHLVERLRVADIEVTVVGSDELFNSLAELQRYDAVVLANVARSGVDDLDNVASFSDDQIEMLVRNTRELGCGLVMLGGPDTYGAGGWANTKLEEAMPVDFQIKSAQVVPVGALALMMHAGEMAQSNYWQKRIAIESVKLLGARDYCGVVLWTGGNDSWLWGRSRGGMMRVGQNRKMMLGLMDKMSIEDMPAFDGGMKMAAAAFTGLPDAAVKHMIIISDGDPTPPTAGTMRAFISQGIKITTVAVDSHGLQGSAEMQRIATRTGGKYYYVKNASALPKIYQREARKVARPLVYEPPNPMQPIVTSADHEILRGVEGGAPPITGYVLTTVKQNPLVEVILRAPQPEKEDNSTLLAAWTYGAGKTVAFTTDAGNRWASSWTEWDGYDKLFSQMVRWAMRPSGDTGNFTVATDVKDGRTQVIITATGDDEEFLNNQSMRATAVAPDMTTLPIRVEQVAPGRYVGDFPSEMAGSYLIVVDPGAGKGQIRTGVNVGYSAEYRDNETNLALLNSLARIPAGKGPQGQFVKDGLMASAAAEKMEADPFRRDLPPALTNQPIWHWLVVAASCLFWGDVFVRRVQVNFEWLPVALGRARDYVLRREREVPVPETMSRLRSRKQEIGEQIETRRATARFEITDPTAATAPPPVAGAPPSTQPQQPKPTTPTLKPDAPPPESYTERLLKAKKQVWQDRDEDQKKKD